MVLVGGRGRRVGVGVGVGVGAGVRTRVGDVQTDDGGGGFLRLGGEGRRKDGGGRGERGAWGGVCCKRGLLADNGTTDGMQWDMYVYAYVVNATRGFRRL